MESSSFDTPRYSTHLSESASRPSGAGITSGRLTNTTDTPGTIASRSAPVFIVALIENKFREVIIILEFSLLILAKQVGLAAMNIHSPELLLTQSADSPTYVNTMAMLQFYEPTEVRFRYFQSV